MQVKSWGNGRKPRFFPVCEAVDRPGETGMFNASRWTDRDGPRVVRARLEAVLWQKMKTRRNLIPPFPMAATGHPERRLMMGSAISLVGG